MFMLLSVVTREREGVGRSGRERVLNKKYFILHYWYWLKKEKKERKRDIKRERHKRKRKEREF